MKQLKLLITCGIILVVGVVIIIYLLKSVPSPSQRTSIIQSEASEGTKEDPHARARYKWLLLRDPATNEIPRDIGRRELALVKNLAQQTMGQNLAVTTEWIARGPRNIGGRTKALALDVTDESTILAGCVSSGMYKSTDGGAYWTKTTAPDQLHSVSCIAQNKAPGKDSIWY
ncbi:MAG: hypothetical protein WBD28_11270, partial [Candidatus Zixiibacteriota bacterium]